MLTTQYTQGNGQMKIGHFYTWLRKSSHILDQPGEAGGW
ncbi:hypothetical protein DB29_01989 [Shouchella clausii]|nr:hypothetical protein DB29_01989 [Shouchella clausii]